MCAQSSTDFVADGVMKRFHGCTDGLFRLARKSAKSDY